MKITLTYIFLSIHLTNKFIIHHNNVQIEFNLIIKFYQNESSNQNW